MQTTYLGGGCFWCTEAIFKNLKGVISVMPGYAGGHSVNPFYEQVCAGGTGHAEVIEVQYDENIISFNNILDVFFSVHDPTTLNRQGKDAGEQYRSMVLTTSSEQEKQVNAKIQELTEQKIYKNPIVTEVKPIDVFYPAEEYHRDYFAKNPDKAYCQLVINPKLNKFKEKWKFFLKF